MLWDTHMHCYFSDDCDTPPIQMVEAAIRRGLTGICFTDHLDLDYREDPGYFDLDFNNYYQEIMSLKETYANHLPILWGIELGLQPHVAEENKKIIETYPFDFVIGSTHIVDHIDIYYPPFYENRAEDDCYLQYFEETLENAETATEVMKILMPQANRPDKYILGEYLFDIYEQEITIGGTKVTAIVQEVPQGTDVIFMWEGALVTIVSYAGVDVLTDEFWEDFRVQVYNG